MADVGAAPEGEYDEANPLEEEEDMFDDDYEDPKQMIREMGDHPLMERVQDALYQQLQNSHERVSLELREREEELKRVKTKREDIGVELYGVQQQLAKLQPMVCSQ